jgi:hypothetical protein
MQNRRRNPPAASESPSGKTMSLCKAHGKERNVICSSKPSGKSGRVFEYVGCVDCKNGVPSQLTPRQTPAPKGKPVKGSPPGKKKVFEPSPHTLPKKTPAKNGGVDLAHEKEKVGRRGFLGFKF